MSVVVGAGVCTLPDASAAGAQVARDVLPALGGRPVDLAVLFASGEHLAEPEALLEGVNALLAPRALIGCGAGGVLGEGREVESGTAVALWAACLGAGAYAEPFHAEAVTGPDEAALVEVPGAALIGVPRAGDASGASGAILLSDPFTFPTELALGEIEVAIPAVPLLGGISSARTTQGAALFLGDELHRAGAVGAILHGVEMLPCVSQGAAPFGRELTITEARGNVIVELAGRPALEAIEAAISELPPHELALVAGGLLIGVVIDTGRPAYEQGDFLVRGILGVDPDSGAVAVGAPVRPGQVVRLHARDARSADADLHRELAVRAAATSGRPPAGALVFSCNGRGRQMFGVPDHDARVVRDELAGAPAAGFFAAGEIGPVGGRSFLHGFTATVAVFPGE